MQKNVKKMAKKIKMVFHLDTSVPRVGAFSHGGPCVRLPATSTAPVVACVCSSLRV